MWTVFATELHLFIFATPLHLFLMKSLLFPTLLLTVALALIGCKKDDDDKPNTETERPAIALVNGSTTTANVAAGGPLTLHVRYTDNVGLSQAKIEIHNDFDGHGHGKTDVTVDTLTYDEILELGGKTDSTHTFNILTSATNQPGRYHVILTALDVNGNEAFFVEIDLTLTNSHFPQVSAVSLKEGSTVISGDHYHLEFPAGSSADQVRTLSASLAAQGSATLTTVKVVLKHTGGEILLFEQNNIGAATYTLTDQQLNFVKSTLTNGGEYALLIEVTDSEGRTTEYEVIDLHVMFL